jgi:hypothetical protein
MKKTLNYNNMSEKPTTEELIEGLKTSIELRKVQLELQQLNTAMAVSRAEEVRALSFMAQMREPEEDDAIPHVVTQEDIDNNPELKEAGVAVGQEILIPNPKPKNRNLKKAK